MRKFVTVLFLLISVGFMFGHIEVQNDPGPPGDPGQHSNHGTDSDGSSTGTSASCKSKVCTKKFDGREYTCVCCISGARGTISCVECDTYECGG